MKYTAIAIEECYHLIIRDFNNNHWSGNTVVHLIDFFDHLCHFKQFISVYLPEIMKGLPDICKQISCVCSGPDNGKKLLDSAIRLHHVINDENVKKEFQTITEYIKTLYELQLLAVGNPAEVYQNNFDESLPDWLLEISKSPDYSCFEKRDIILNSNDLSDVCLQRFQSLFNQLQTLFPQRDNSIWIPVVQQDSIHHSGTLLPLQISLTVHSEHQHAVTPALAAASRFIQARHHITIDEHYKINLLTDDQGWSLQGQSHSAGLSLLAAQLLADKHLPRIEIRTQKHTCITGIIQPDGYIQPVSSESLGAKVKAAFFSPLTSFAVPVKQLLAAEHIAKKLAAEYPGKNLIIIGINTLNDICNDQRICRYRSIPFHQRTWRKVIHHKWEIFTTSIALLLLIFLLKLLIGPTDRNAVTYAVKSDRIEFLNESSQKLGSFSLNQSSLRSLSNSHRATSNLYRIIFVDITGNGLNDVILNNRMQGRYDEIIAYDIQADSTIWKFDLFRSLTYSDNSDFISNDFRSRGMTLNADTTQLFVSAGHYFFPSYISKHNLYSGTEIDYFLHAGRIRDFVLTEADEHGNQQLLFGGVNNAYNEAVIGVLDPNSMKGQSPATEPYLADEMEVSLGLIKYFRIPKTIVGQAYLAESRYSQTNRIEIENQFIRADIVDYYIQGNRQERHLSIYFDSNFTPVGVGRSSEYDIDVRQLYQDGRIDMTPDNEYFTTWMKSFKYWNGDDWETGF